jgi:hypothetical protein
LNCQEIQEERNEQGRLHNDENWESLQDTHKQVVGLEKSSIPARFDATVASYQVPIEIAFAEEEKVGRGV